MKFLLVVFLSLNAFALGTADIKSYFEKAEYPKICNQKIQDLLKDSQNEEFLNIFGISCLKTNDIDRLALPASKLSKTQSSRENAAYFADILLKKKLLLHAILDGADISYIRLPKSDYILSFIFDKFVKKEYVEELGVFIFEEPNSDTRYELSAIVGSNFPKMILKIFKNDDLTSQIEYR
ncbi:hypothetical protein [Campylobacter concisus]|uniref:hypothetical protein n=1 Tax=Campylobacter concisus TaxID=199 RepID=UPI00122CAFCC|nr:hypothetical protein [Campylobacter concisus]